MGSARIRDTADLRFVMRQVKIDQLASLGLFAGVSRVTLDAVAEGALIRSCPAGVQIVEQGATPEFLNVLLHGCVETVGKGPDGRETVVQILDPVDYFVLAAVLTDAPHLVGARTVEPAQLLLIPAQNLRDAAAGDHRLTLNILSAQALQFRTMIRRIKNLTLRGAVQRLGCYLVALRDETGSATVTLPVSKRSLAARLGMTPESVSRAFAALREHGVSVSGRTVKLRDPELVRAECGPDPLIDRDCRESALADGERLSA